MRRSYAAGQWAIFRIGGPEDRRTRRPELTARPRISGTTNFAAQIDAATTTLLPYASPTLLARCILALPANRIPEFPEDPTRRAALKRQQRTFESKTLAYLVLGEWPTNIEPFAVQEGESLIRYARNV